MAERFNIDLKGLDQIERKLGKLARAVVEMNMLEAAGEEIKSRMMVYPPATSGNSPSNPTGHWYERGYGIRHAPTGKGRRTSENLGRRWFVKSGRRFGVLLVKIGNPVSYASIVHGIKQARFHKRHGWKKLSDVAKKELPKIRQKALRVFREIIRARA